MNPDQVSLGNKNNGINVVIICTNRSGMTTRSVPFIKNKSPIKHSNKPNKIRNVGKLIKGIVSLNNLSTTPLAGLSPMIFKNPNQKKTTNNPNLATGTETFLK